MPKVGHSSVFEYKSRITDLESEVSTLKRRLEELRRAKMQAFYKQPAILRRCSKPDITVPVEPAPSPPPAPPSLPDVSAALTQKITRLHNELELEKLRYTRDTGELKDKIKLLQEEMLRGQEGYQCEIKALNKEHFIALELLKKSHTEELALYEENISQDRDARMTAENELSDYKHHLRSATIQIPDIESLKNELSRLQHAYEELKQEHEKEVADLERRIGELLADIAANNEKSKRRFQLIPDRAYIVKKSSPTVSSSSIGSVSDRKPRVGVNPVNSSTPRTSSAPRTSTPRTINSPETRATKKPDLISPPNLESTSPKTNNTNQPLTDSTHKLETINRSKNSSPVRPKSCIVRKSTSAVQQPDRVSLCRPKSCWSDRRCTGGSLKRNPTAARPKFTNVNSKINTGLVDPVPLFPECGMKYKPVRRGSIGSPVPPWQVPVSTPAPKGNRGYVARNKCL